MKLKIHKYHGAGNDFILTYGGSKGLRLGEPLIRLLCDRHLGVGADGYLELLSSRDADFEVRYFNADGRIGSLCGNGSRCAVHLARRLGLCKRKARFIAADGLHQAVVADKATVRISFRPILLRDASLPMFIDTGSPHLIFVVDDVHAVDVQKEGKQIRYSEPYRAEGVNVNFLNLKNGQVHLRTYERGVEQETLSCGSGAVAAALAAAALQNWYGNDLKVAVHMAGGTLQVFFSRPSAHQFTDIWLEGPVTHVFTALVNLSKLSSQLTKR
ncbi:MAG: diaminopimelate epimerase [Chitinophagales bacterium]|nr:diaminopimelate epimerase [Chitinophagales bacterium]MDW8428801.1 diaminopimelate epimerase [Chitinophagales bacterium]